MRVKYLTVTHLILSLSNQFLRNLVIIKHDLRMIVTNQLLIGHLSGCPVNDISIDFGYPVILISFFMEMMIFFKNLIILQELSFAS